MNDPKQTTRARWLAGLTIAFLLAACAGVQGTNAARSAAAGDESGVTSKSGPRNRDSMRLYRRLGDGALAYHEAWRTASGITEHWGIVGDRGETHQHPAEATIEGVLERSLKGGFAEATKEHFVLIEYKIDGMGEEAELKKRFALQERMDDVLGWTGLGYCDGGSTGSDTMEVAVVVVDVEIAKRVIAADLKGTPFQDYTRIFQEGS